MISTFSRFSSVIEVYPSNGERSAIAQSSKSAAISVGISLSANAEISLSEVQREQDSSSSFGQFPAVIPLREVSPVHLNIVKSVSSGLEPRNERSVKRSLLAMLSLSSFVRLLIFSIFLIAPSIFKDTRLTAYWIPSISVTPEPALTDREVIPAISSSVTAAFSSCFRVLLISFLKF